MQGLLNCGKGNLLLGCLEVSMEDILHRAGLSLHSSASIQRCHTCCSRLLQCCSSGRSALGGCRHADEESPGSQLAVGEAAVKAHLQASTYR